MQINPLGIEHSFEIIPKIHSDSRGEFWESYRFDFLSNAVGHPLDLKQGNASISKKGVVRGVHFATLRPGQAKYVSCLRGEVLDFIVDIRTGSPTFGKWDSVLLSDEKKNSVYLSEGLGHAFVALTSSAAVNYMVTSTYNPSMEFGINPLDSDLNLQFPQGLELLLSEKDTEAPSLIEAVELGLLPSFADAQARYVELDKDGGQH